MNFIGFFLESLNTQPYIIESSAVTELQPIIKVEENICQYPLSSIWKILNTNEMEESRNKNDQYA
jgi:hypothetical protein